MLSHDPAEVHFFFGMALRNEWHLWVETTPLVQDFKKRYDLFGHADDISGTILDGLWARVKGESVEEGCQKSADRCREHWLKHGAGPGDQ